jgi:hypothetical protein
VKLPKDVVILKLLVPPPPVTVAFEIPAAEIVNESLAEPKLYVEPAEALVAVTVIAPA